MIRFSVFYREIKKRGSNLDNYVFVFYMFSNPWKGHRCCQWLVPHYEFKNIVGGINLWSVNQHKGKFPSLVARQPPPIKITIKSHAFYAGISNSRTQLLAFKETRRQTTSEIFIACPLMIRNREWKCIQTTFSGGVSLQTYYPNTRCDSGPQRRWVLCIKTPHKPEKLYAHASSSIWDVPTEVRPLL